ncbi:BrnA antitoxin family protein [Pseudorhodoferax sp. LjRoot39]|uniref:BrnA antitoxin family protein n=1 Tax=Pseudorhodoferax sp. LjRoot39 TaxID=3342328 RepID=UPI003ECCD573
MIANKRATAKDWVDPDDAPELDDAFFERADEFRDQVLVKRGRPKAAATKEPVKLRLDPDVVEALRATGDGWQTRINDMLRASLVLAGRLG